MKLLIFALLLTNTSLNALDSNLSFATIIEHIEKGDLRHNPNKLINDLLPFARNRHHILSRGYLWLFHCYPKTFFKQEYNSTVEVRNIVEQFEIDMCLAPLSSLNPQQILWQKSEDIPSLTKKILLHYLEPAFCINELFRASNVKCFPTLKEYQETLSLLVDAYVNLSGRSFCILHQIINATPKEHRLFALKHYLQDSENYRDLINHIQEKSAHMPHDSLMQQEISQHIEALLEKVWQEPLRSALLKKSRLQEPKSFGRMPLTDGDYEYAMAPFCLPNYQQDYFLTTSCCLGHPFALAFKLIKRSELLPAKHFEFLYDGIPDDYLFRLHDIEPTGIDELIQTMQGINPGKTTELIIRICLNNWQFSGERPKNSIQKKPSGYLGQFNY